ncbi:mitochondrial 2-oxoglutarate/malate carrier protein-like [Cylas formicarius]|uniref:mitochondrial 2-oxoglutarate/malate carrier protein-like n=1 Tax=Cylas formicarius TaxID=197179 RepID=UPI0029584743|nr:mitochondrial 2-oxoglutarate/malate carrier protein-like [Cylas formicarius]
MAAPEKRIPTPYKFLFGGGAGCCAVLFVHPLDLMKNRMQMSGLGVRTKEHRTTFHLMVHIIRNEGLLALYNGFTAGLFRQATYTTTRLGVFTWLFDVFTVDGQTPGLSLKVGLGMVAGLCGAIVGTPAEVTWIRMTSDNRLPPEKRRNYKHVFDALIRIKREEGIKTWWRGLVPTMARFVVVNGAQLSSYTQSKQLLLETEKFREGILLHFCASMIAGFVTSVISLPVDIVKTRVQNMARINGGQTNPIPIVTGIFKSEGILAFWKGFTPYYMGIGPYTVLSFIFLEQFYRAYRKYSRD